MKHAFMEYEEWCMKKDIVPTEEGFIEWWSEKVDRDHEAMKDREIPLEH